MNTKNLFYNWLDSYFKLCVEGVIANACPNIISAVIAFKSFSCIIIEKIVAERGIKIVVIIRFFLQEHGQYVRSLAIKQTYDCALRVNIYSWIGVS